MHNIIFTTYDRKKGSEYVSIGSDWYMKEQIRRTGRQLVKIVGIIQTEEQRELCKQMSVEELYKGLMSFQEENSLKVMYLN